MESAKRQRIFYIDFVKTIAIYMVVSYHFIYSGDESPLGEFPLWYRFFFHVKTAGVPLFFLANGAVLLNSPFNMKSYLKRLIVFFLNFWLFRTITILYVGYRLNYPFLDNGIVNFLNVLFFFQSIEEIDLSHLWFAYTFISVQFLFPFAHAFLKHLDQKEYEGYLKFYLFIMVLFAFIVYDLSRIPFISRFRWMFVRELDPIKAPTIQMFVYFTLGGLIEKYRNKARECNPLYLIGGIIVGLVGIFLLWYMSAVNGTRMDFVFEGYYSFAGFITSLSLYLLIIKISDRLEIIPFFRYWCTVIGSSTLYIYYIHWLIEMTYGHGPFLIEMPLSIIAVFTIAYLVLLIRSIKN